MSLSESSFRVSALVGLSVALSLAVAAGTWYVAGAVYRGIDPGKCEWEGVGGESYYWQSSNWTVTSEPDFSPRCVPAALIWLGMMVGALIPGIAGVWRVTERWLLAETQRVRAPFVGDDDYD